MYIYIYIYCHPQTDCFVVSQLFSVVCHVGRSELGSKPTQLYVRLSIRPLGPQGYHVGLGNYKVLCSNSSSSVSLFTFYTLPDTRVLNSFEELCIMRAAAENSFARVLNPHWGAYIYIYIWSERLGFNPRTSHTKHSKNGIWCRLAQHSALSGTDQG